MLAVVAVVFQIYYALFAAAVALNERCDRRVQYFTQEDLADDKIEEVRRIIQSANKSRCIDNFRMSREQFLELLQLIRADLAVTPKLPADFQLAIYLNWIAFDSTVREQKERYRISHELVIKCRRAVAAAIMLRVYPVYVRPLATIPVIENPKFIRFQGAFGAIDGSHISISVPTRLKGKFRCRKGFTSTNGCFVCDLEALTFNYALIGAEGIASDAQVYGVAKNLIHWLAGGYLLGDAGYGLTRRILVPYRGVINAPEK